MPLDPLRVVYVWPAPKSRLVVSGLAKQEDQKPKPKPKRKQKLEVVRSPVAVRLAGGSDLTDANAGKPDCYRGLCPPPNL
jgi:hypothetical protein